MSPPRFLLDSNVAIGYLDGRESVRNLVDAHRAVPTNSAVSQITRIEMLSYWALSAAEESKITRLLSSMAVILLDEVIEREAIAFRRRTRMKLPDAIIAATARVHGLQLLTLDERLDAAFRAG